MKCQISHPSPSSKRATKTSMYFVRDFTRASGFCLRESFHLMQGKNTAKIAERISGRGSYGSTESRPTVHGKIHRLLAEDGQQIPDLLVNLLRSRHGLRDLLAHHFAVTLAHPMHRGGDGAPGQPQASADLRVR